MPGLKQRVMQSGAFVRQGHAVQLFTLHLPLLIKGSFMSKLAEFKALEAQLAAQLKQLDEMKKDGTLKREIEFEKKLRDLMAEYGFSLKNIIAVLDPSARPSVATSMSAVRGVRRKRQVKVYKNPETAEVVETKGGNHKVLKAWREQYGAEVVEGWLQ